MIDWEKLREMMRKDLSRFIAQDKLSDKDYCDLKLILSNLERTYTNEMFENDDELYSKNYSGARNGYRVATRGRAYHDDMSDNYHEGRNQYSGHAQEEIFKSQLQAMMHTAEDANTRRVIQEAMDKLR